MVGKQIEKASKLLHQLHQLLFQKSGPFKGIQWIWSRLWFESGGGFGFS